jgi:tetratricopeptide (TPR) repeat protein
MVVKNESLFIRACIESALPIAQEVIVVDTGSTDGTVKIARSLGAQVYEEPWPGDLGTAHNLPLRYARGDWILVLDGDEMLDSSAKQIIPDLCGSELADGYAFTFRNYLFQPHPNWKPCDPVHPLSRGALGWAPSNAVRLFRNDHRYRYEGYVHERISGSIVAAGGRIERSSMPIHHYGMLRCDRDKGPMYVSLAARQVERSPDGLRCLELGIACLMTQDVAAARQAFERARASGRPAEASFYLARIEAESGNPAAAIAHLQRASAAMTTNETGMIHCADIVEELGCNLEAAGRRDEAVQALQRTLEMRPDSPVALTELTGLLIEEQRFDDAAVFAGRMLERYRGLEATWTTQGNLHLARGDLAGAISAFLTALDIDSKCVIARVNLTIAYARAGQLKAAHGALAGAQQLKNGEPLARLNPALVKAAAQRTPSLILKSGTKPLIVSVTDHLHSGSGRVLADVAVVLAPQYRQLVLVQDPGDISGMQMRDELERVGIDVRTMAWGEDLQRQLESIRPSLVILHWWSAQGTPIPEPRRIAGEAWVCVGHSSLPMPQGYDAYVILSDFHRQSQQHLPAVRVHLIPNAIDLANFRRLRRRETPPVTIATLGRLDPEKFPRRLLHNSASNSPIMLTFVLSKRRPINST